MTGPARMKRRDRSGAAPYRRAITMAVAVVILVLGYERMRDSADYEAGALHAAHRHPVTQAANGTATRSGNRRQVPAAPLAAQRTP